MELLHFLTGFVQLGGDNALRNNILVLLVQDGHLYDRYSFDISVQEY